MRIDIEHECIDIMVDGQQILHIAQVSDKETINLFLYPEGDLVESMVCKEGEDNSCTHKILVSRKPKEQGVKIEFDVSGEVWIDEELYVKVEAKQVNYSDHIIIEFNEFMEEV